jgi:hypothetical protein
MKPKLQEEFRNEPDSPTTRANTAETARVKTLAVIKVT